MLHHKPAVAERLPFERRSAAPRLCVVGIYLLAFIFSSVDGLEIRNDKGGPRVALLLNVDMAQFLERQAPVWNWTADATTLPSAWYEGAFTGNGVQGTMLTLHGGSADSNSYIRIELGRTDVYDDRPRSGPLSTRNFVFDRPRLPIGYIKVPLTGSITGGGMRISLHDARVEGHVNTTTGVTYFQVYTHATRDVSVVKLSPVPFSSVNERNGPRSPSAAAASSTGDELSASSLDSPFGAPVFINESAQSTWAPQDKSYIPNAPAQTGMNDKGCHFTTQTLLTGNAYSTAVLFQKPNHADIKNKDGFEEDNGLVTLFVSVSPVLSLYDSENTACTAVASAAAVKDDGLWIMHQDWWHDYYLQSFVTLQDTKVESFYYIQQYKIASATRGNGTVFDLEGPWFAENTAWPDVHWDLNLQLTYFTMYTGNRLGLAESLLNYIDDILPNLILNVQADWQIDSAAAPSSASSIHGFETCYWQHRPDCHTGPPTITGNLLWVLHNYWRHYDVSRDPSILPRLYNVLRRAVNFYVHFVSKSSTDGLYHLPVTFSPEYPYRGPDTNYDLALLRWALPVAIDTAQRLGKDKTDPSVGAWKELLPHLAPYPVDPSTGYMIAAGVPLNVSHRHFSHLLMVFPLSTIDWENASTYSLAERSFDHWIGMSGGLTGFSRTAAASMSVPFGRKKSAFGNLTYLLDNYIHANTMYSEGNNFPCGETPPAAASSLQDMMLFNYSGAVSVFPGVDDVAMGDVSFYRLRSSGGVLVSASRKASQTEWIVLEADGPVPVEYHMRIDDLDVNDVVIYPALSVPRSVDGDVLILQLMPGIVASLTPRSSTDRTSFSVFASTPLTSLNFWGKQIPKTDSSLIDSRFVGAMAALVVLFTIFTLARN